jgi:hypothetical protein
VAIAAGFKARHYLPKVYLPAIFANKAILDVDDEVHVLGHYYVILYLYDGVVLRNAVAQLVFHHLSDGR